MPRRYRTIVADPPWKIAGKRMRAGGRRARDTEVDYEFLGLEEIEQLQVEEMADESCALFMWSTRKLFREGAAVQVARAWGFEPCGEIIWGLRNPGMGTRAIANDHEPILVATRGPSPLTASEPIGVYFWRQIYASGGGKVHSAKPDAFLDHVEAWSPGPYLELFARRARFGWDYWGDESLGTAELPAPSTQEVAG
jgi:N6-adenosine-specific RNA methylase IME4